MLLKILGRAGPITVVVRLKLLHFFERFAKSFQYTSTKYIRFRRFYSVFRLANRSWTKGRKYEVRKSGGLGIVFPKCFFF